MRKRERQTERKRLRNRERERELTPIKTEFYEDYNVQLFFTIYTIIVTVCCQT